MTQLRAEVSHFRERKSTPATLAQRQGSQRGSRRHLGAPDADPLVRWSRSREDSQPGGLILADSRHLPDSPQLKRKPYRSPKQGLNEKGNGPLAPA